ncbi:MAG: hypothetical protein IJX17_03390 [Clostridia bacterium]|nr:hypothetical protein [Clostridia bacterium]
MGFYQSKLNTYSKYITFNPQLMAVTQKKIIETREKKLEEMKEDMRLSRRFHLEEVRGISEVDLEIYEREIKFLKTLDTVDFYQHLINMENYNLVEILQESATKRNEYVRTIDKFSNKSTGMFGHNKTLGGIANRKIEKNTRALRDADLTIGLTAESMAEWKGLIPDDHVIYLVGRFELEGKDSFDKKGFDQYKEMIYKLKHIKEESQKTVPSEKD